MFITCIESDLVAAARSIQKVPGGSSFEVLSKHRRKISMLDGLGIPPLLTHMVSCYSSPRWFLHMFPLVHSTGVRTGVDAGEDAADGLSSVTGYPDSG